MIRAVTSSMRQRPTKSNQMEKSYDNFGGMTIMVKSLTSILPGLIGPDEKTFLTN